MNSQNENYFNYNPSRRLSLLYISALSAIAVTALLAQVLIQGALKNQEKDSFIVNMAGRQRMLSQKICKLALLLDRSKSMPDSDRLQDFQNALELWKKFHNGLSSRRGVEGLEGQNSKEIQQLFNEINPYFLILADNATIFLRSVKAQSHVARRESFLQKILSAEGHYLTGMDTIVFRYQEEARDKVALLEKGELTLFLITLLILLAEGLFVFRPAVNQIRETIRHLTEAERRTGKAYDQLCHAEKQLSKANEALEWKIRERTHEVLVQYTELEKQNMLLAKMNKDLDTFVYSASHDLKAPINNIQALMQILVTNVPETKEKAGEILEMIDESINKFQTVINDLSVTGKERMQVLEQGEQIYFQDILDEIKVSMEEMIEASGTIITEDFNQAAEIRYSRKNLRSILYNLISNAIKYCSPDRKPDIRINTLRADGHVLLTVKDNGLGIRKEDVDKIFGMYKRLHSHVEGTGVGLNIVARIIENNGGRIEVQSEEGKGSTFKVYFKA